MYYVYIMTNFSNSVLYTGVTNSLICRVFEHKNKVTKGFTSKYSINKLVYFEHGVIAREKQIKQDQEENKLN